VRNTPPQSSLLPLAYRRVPPRDLFVREREGPLMLHLSFPIQFFFLIILSFVTPSELPSESPSPRPLTHHILVRASTHITPYSPRLAPFAQPYVRAPNASSRIYECTQLILTTCSPPPRFSLFLEFLIDTNHLRLCLPPPPPPPPPLSPPPPFTRVSDV